MWDLLKALSSVNLQPLCACTTGLCLLHVTADISKTGNSCLVLLSYSFAMHNYIRIQLLVMKIDDTFSSDESAPWWVICKKENSMRVRVLLGFSYTLAYTPLVLAWNFYLGSEKVKKFANEKLIRPECFARGSFVYETRGCDIVPRSCCWLRSITPYGPWLTPKGEEP